MARLKKTLKPKLLEVLSPYKRIAWYPSAGTDFCVLKYLSGFYTEKSIGLVCPNQPEVFVFTDYNINPYNEFDIEKRFHDDDNDTIYKILETRSLTPISCEFYSEMVVAERKEYYNNAVLLNVEVEQNHRKYTFPVIYISVVNEAFYNNFIAINNIKLSHIIHVRYGGGVFGGSNTSGAWLQNIIQHVECDLFVTDQHLSYLEMDNYFIDIIRPIGLDTVSNYTTIHTIPSTEWSNHGLVEFRKIVN
jgi:hypothetical protein